MARPQKYNADYFPHRNDFRNDRRCKALRSKFGLEGYAVFVMLLEILIGANHFQIKGDKMEIELIAGDIDINSNLLNGIINYLVELGLLEKKEGIISSTLLNELKTILEEIRSTDRKRKAENTTKENDTKENGVFQLDNKVFQTENTQSKEKESKEKEKKENIIQGEAPDFNSCKEFFLKEAKGYYWEAKDDTNLKQLLHKIQIARADVGLKYAFQLFIKGLPEYWRTKKFTIQHLNVNFNEIKTEMTIKNDGKKIHTNPIQASYRHITANTGVNQGKIDGKSVEQTEIEKQETEQKFIKQVCDAYENYCKTGDFNIWPIRLVYDLFVKRKLLQLSENQQKEYQVKAVEKRKQELSKPQNRDEKFRFKHLLESYTTGIDQNEQGRIERLKQEFVVLDFLKQSKEKNIDFKNLFTK